MTDNKGLSDTTTGEKSPELDFDAVSKAITDNDISSLGKLMEEKEDTEEKKEEKVEEVKEEKDEPEDKSSKSDDKTEEEDENVDTKDETGSKEDKPDEAAKSAASTDQTPAELEELRKELEAMKQERHRYMSDAGRVPYLQRRQAELERELRAYKARTPDQSKDGKAAITAADLKEVVLDSETAAELEELKKVDPVMARTMERIAKTAIVTAERRDEQVVKTFNEADEEREEQRLFMEQKAELTRLIPQHEQVFRSNEWRQWKDSLTPTYRALAESPYANEVAQAIYAFAADMQKLRGNQAAPEKKETTSSDNAAITKERARKMESSTEVKNTAAKASETLDEQAIFEQAYKKIGKDSHIL